MTVAMVERLVGNPLTNKGFISDSYWGRTTRSLVKEGMPLDLAERTIDQAVGFVRGCCQAKPGELVSLTPSRPVDRGWHKLREYSREYDALCQKYGGRYIHHEPFDEEGVDYSAASIEQTIATLRRYGLVIDEPLWDCTGQECGPACDNRPDGDVVC